MKRSNYDQMLETAQELFLAYDQAAMVEKFHLDGDDTYLYLTCIGRPYRIERRTGALQWLDGAGQSHAAGFNDGMTIYDILCYSRPDCRLSGQYGPINSVASSYHTSGLGDALFADDAAFFAARPEALVRACQALGGRPEGRGDIAYRLEVFPFFPVRVQFWQADEDFPASLQLHWDMNTLSFLHYETTYYLAGHLFARLRELAAAC